MMRYAPNTSKAVLAYIFHQPLDDKQADHEGNHAADRQNRPLRACCGNAGKQEFHKLQYACTKHRGDGKEEGELCPCRSAYTKDDCTQNGGAGTGGAGNQAQALEAADEHGSFSNQYRTLNLRRLCGGCFLAPQTKTQSRKQSK